MKTDFWQRKICGIYLIQHKETGRAYVGQSCDCLKRWKAHTTPGKKSSGIAGAIKDAGVDKFIFCILEEVSKDLLNEREKHWIAKYDCMEPNGWNRTSGGSGSTAANVSKETRAKLSAMRKGVAKSPEHIANQAAAQSITKKGKKPSEETRKKMSAARTGKKKSQESKDRMSASGKEAWKKKRALKVSSESPLD